MAQIMNASFKDQGQGSFLGSKSDNCGIPVQVLAHLAGHVN